MQHVHETIPRVLWIHVIVLFSLLQWMTV